MQVNKKYLIIPSTVRDFEAIFCDDITDLLAAYQMLLFTKRLAPIIVFTLTVSNCIRQLALLINSNSQQDNLSSLLCSTAYHPSRVI